MVAFQKKVKLQMLDNSDIRTVRSKIKKIETPMINILQLAARKNVIEILTNCQLKFLVTANSNFFFDLTVIKLLG
jgi:hypothetical protein